MPLTAVQPPPPAARRPTARPLRPAATEPPTVEVRRPARPQTPAAAQARTVDVRRPARPQTPAAAPPPAGDARRTARPLTPAEADILRIVSDARTPVFVTQSANGRRRYSHWRPLDSATGRGGCYVALPTADCDALRDAGRITLGDPVSDPSRTTYRVRAARTPSPTVRLAAVPAGPARDRVRAA